ncbi:Y-family DNA polymerase [Niallia endozanthoxylica]|uniref:UV damage repair protein UvrX n=1 Tax=Niallia endozanthoxylica TaxID=2036016 RepID=A0A5J5HP30_9BACI|nr:UV damage repair protein UvrX [Niallia endozanthoxylica]KAA9022888.1 UV damage repair protein UvrX [Niallia endozanthoxylica]
MDYSPFPNRSILCVDMKSFYSSCAAVMLGLDPMTCYLAVVGHTDRQGSVVLAASPALKREFNIKTGSRLFEIPNNPKIHIVNPSMSSYLKTSAAIIQLFNRFVPFSDMHPYSVDESFLDVTGVRRLWGDPETIAFKIQETIKKEFGLPSTIGIGPNMLLAKLCLDLEAKHSTTGIAKWTYDDVQAKLWPTYPLSQMWGIGPRMERNLNGMGIFNVGALANYPLKLLEKKFGVMGRQIHQHAWGIDFSKIGDPVKQEQVSFGKSQILLRDYPNPKDVKQVILEMCEEVARQARKYKKSGRTVSLGIGYSKDEFGGGFHRAKSLDYPTNITLEMYQTCLTLFDTFYSNKTVRQISVTLSNIEDDDTIQLDLFQQDREKQRILGYVMDAIRDKYGPMALLRGVSYTHAGTARYRSHLVGGHHS